MNEGKIVRYLETNFGFTDHQAKLYVAGLRLRDSLMTHLALGADVARSTAYYAIDELLRRGFFIKEKRGRRTYYIPASTKQLLTMIQKREHITRKILPHLKKIERLNKN